MVLETLVSGAIAKRKFWMLFYLGMLYATIGIFLAHWVFPDQSSLVMVFLTVLASAHVMHSLVKHEELVDEELTDERAILINHSRTIAAFMFLFFGFTVAMTFWYIATDWPIVQFLVDDPQMSNKVFKVQNDTVAYLTGRVTAFDTFMVIFTNNLMVLLFSGLFSFVYGYGAIFVLAWNASVIAAAAGASYKYAVAIQGDVFTHIVAFLGSLGQYALHGIPEIAGFFVAALAAGIMGVAIARKTYRDPVKFRRVLIDTADLSIIAVTLVFVAAILEVWVTPLLIV